MICIEITSATRTGITATVTKTPGLKLSVASVRTLILNMAAHEMGKDTRALTAAPGPLKTDGMGYDLRDGWAVESATEDGVKVDTYTVNPISGYDRALKLHEQGGTTPAKGGGFNFWLPGEYPKPSRTTVTVKRQR